MTAWAFYAALACAPLSAWAANTPRHSHTASLMPTGNMVIAGGVSLGGVPINLVELRLTSRDGSALDAAPMSVARASHTATVMVNGRLLVTGGWNTGVTILNTAEVYDPSTNAWTPTGNNMSSVRFNHTATLLDDGRVLVCGGQTNLAVPAVTASCDTYDPATNLFTPTAGSMQQGRAIHTAVNLKNGQVWFAGGWNPAVNPTYLATTERFNPTTGLFNSAAPLAQGRAFHTATMSGDGKVLVAGGYNGDNALINANNFGILQTAQIYDPVTNSMSPAASLGARRMMHSATLSSDGLIRLMGGLGNVATTYVLSEITGKRLLPGSNVTVSFTPPTDHLTTGTVSGGILTMGMELQLGTPVTGIIEDGEVWLSSPAINFEDVQIQFTPASENNSAVGLRIPLSGMRVDCRTPLDTVEASCGVMSGNFSLANVQGRVHTAPTPLVLTGITPTITAGSLSFAGPLGANQIAAITGGNFTVTMDILVNQAFIGGTLSSGTATLVSGGFVKVTSMSVQLDGGFGSFTSGLITAAPGGTHGQATITVTFSDLSGVITGDQSAGAVASPQDLTGLPVNGLSGSVRLMPTNINLINKTFTINRSTMIIRAMSFGAPEFYHSGLNSWDWQPPSGSAVTASTFASIGLTGTVLPNNDVVFWGGRETRTGLPRVGQSRTVVYTGWGPASSPIGIPRALHTSTLLPDGKILIAGGTNGPNILRSAEIFDPETETFTRTTGMMQEVRDLHTATLLPNGRVLLAGGFTTNTTSTGSTATSEIYYPDTKVFLPAAPMFNARSNHTAVPMPDGGVFVAGGFGPNDVITDTAEVFYSTALAWRTAPSMPSARALHTMTLLKDGRILLAGGVNSGGVLNSVVAFNTLTGAWSVLAPMPIALHSHSATLLLDGRVLVAGGNNGLGEQDVSMVYDPAANTWTNTLFAGAGPLSQPRFSHNAILLPNGNVMISGGTERFGSIRDQIEVYHPTAGSWAEHGTFAIGPNRRAYHTMSLAPNGKLYAIGGSDGTIGGTGSLLWTTVETSHLSTEPDIYSKTGSPGLRRSSITATTTSPFLPNTLFTTVGQQFRGGTEASGGGAGAANSSFSHPRLTLQSLDGSGGSGTQGQSGFILDLTTQVYLNPSNLATLNSSVTVQLPASSAQLPMGWYGVRVSANDVHSPSRIVQVGPLRPTVAPTTVVALPQGHSSMTWTWTAVPGVDGYNVYQATTGVLISTSATTTFTQTGLASNTTASVHVAGFTLSGDGPLGIGATNYTFTSTVTNVTIASVTFTNLRLFWDINGNEPGTIYEVSQSTDNFVGSFSTPVPTVLGNTTNFALIENLFPNTNYSFRVRAFNGAGVPGGFSSVVSTLTRTSIDLISATPGLNIINWGWTNPAGALSFRVYNATTGVLLAAPAAVGANTNFADAPLATNSRRAILVSAVTAAGEGPLLPSATVFTLAQPPLAATPHISPVSTGSIVTNWDINNNPTNTQYRAVFYRVGSTTPVSDTTVPGTVIRAGAGGLQPATLYLSSVAAVNGDGIESAWLVGSTYTDSQEPSNVTVLNTTPVSITLSWDRRNNGPDVQFQVTYSSDQFVSHIATAVPFSSAFNGSSTTINGLNTGTTYWLQVQARTPHGKAGNAVPTALDLSTVTFNGGAPFGALAGVLESDAESQIFGSIGGGRQVDLRSPIGAFSSDVTMTISSFNVVGTLCPNGVNVALSLTNVPNLQPLKPVFLTFSYTPAEAPGISANRLTLFRYEPISGTCVPLETVATADTVRAKINHFSLFQLGQTTLATSASTARIFPNPYRTAVDSYVTIDNVPPSARVRIFTLRGELVLDQTVGATGVLTWSGNNGAGRVVASGLYLVMIDHGSSKKILKLSLLR